MTDPQQPTATNTKRPSTATGKQRQTTGPEEARVTNKGENASLFPDHDCMNGSRLNGLDGYEMGRVR